MIAAEAPSAPIGAAFDLRSGIKRPRASIPQGEGLVPRPGTDRSRKVIKQ